LTEQNLPSLQPLEKSCEPNVYHQHIYSIDGQSCSQQTEVTAMYRKHASRKVGVATLHNRYRKHASSKVGVATLQNDD